MGFWNSLGFGQLVNKGVEDARNSVVKVNSVGDWLARQRDIIYNNNAVLKSEEDPRGIMTYDDYTVESRDKALGEVKSLLDERRKDLPTEPNGLPQDADEDAIANARTQNYEASKQWNDGLDREFFEEPSQAIKDMAYTNPRDYANAMVKHYEEQMKATNMNTWDRGVAYAARRTPRVAGVAVGGVIANSLIGNPVGNTISWLIPGEEPSDNFDIAAPMDEQQRQAELARLKKNMQRDAITAQALSSTANTQGY